MIDIHPPQHAPMTKREFFVHLFIVVLGILIAIGLEQTVDYFHHRHQLAEARRELSTEYKINLAVYRTQRAEFNRFIPILQRNIEILVYLRAHPGAPRSRWPGELSWYHAFPHYLDATWTSLHGTDVLTLMPQSEVQRNTTLYDMLRQFNLDADNTTMPFLHTVSYGFRNQDPASMTSAQIDAAIQSASDMLGFYSKMTDMQINLNARFKKFAPAPSYLDQRNIMGLQTGRPDIDEGVALERRLTAEIGQIQAAAEKRN
jgi:hypothetical protein